MEGAESDSRRLRMTTLATTWVTGADRRGAGVGKAAHGGTGVERSFNPKLASGAKWAGSGFCRGWAAVSGERRRGCAQNRFKSASAFLVDPLGFGAGDSNLYRYVNNGPTNATDPSGQSLLINADQQESLRRIFGAANVRFTDLGGGQFRADFPDADHRDNGFSHMEGFVEGTNGDPAYGKALYFALGSVIKEVSLTDFNAAWKAPAGKNPGIVTKNDGKGNVVVWSAEHAPIGGPDMIIEGKNLKRIPSNRAPEGYILVDEKGRAFSWSTYRTNQVAAQQCAAMFYYSVQGASFAAPFISVELAAGDAIAAALAARQSLIAELARQGVRHTPENIVFIMRTAGGRIIFLESGTAQSGLQHIVAGHAGDFAARGIPQSEIANAIRVALAEGRVVGTTGSGANTRSIYEFVFQGRTQRIAVGVADNGYIGTAHPY
jgi:hypothetical protein